MTLFKGIYDNCIYGTGMPIICTECGGIVRDGLCLPCDLREKDLYNYDPNAYSFDNSNYFPQPQDENYNQNYDPHESLSFPCCDYCGGSHETFQCQTDNQNVDFSGSDQIQTPQYPDVNPPSPEISNEENFQAKGDLMKSLFQTWETFFAIQCSQPEDSNELFQKLIQDLKELAEYDQSTSTDRPIFLNDNEDHSVQNRESPENSSEENVVSKTNQEPPQDSDIHQLIEECSKEVPEQQKQNMEKTMLDLVKICHHKQFLCIYDDVDDLIESALDSKLLSINSINFQRLDKKEQEVKIVEEQPAERRNLAPILSTKEPDHLLSMGYKHLIITPEMESDEVTEYNAENLLPIPSKCEVTSEDEIECDKSAKDESSSIFMTFLNPLFKDNDDLEFSNDESLPDEDVPTEEFKIYSNPLFDEDEISSDKLESHCFNVESDLVESLLNHDTFIDSSSKIDFLLEEFSGELAHINPEIKEADFDFEEEIHLIENFYDSKGDIRFLEALLIDDSILSHESFESNFEENPLIPRPPPEPPDAETDTGEKIPVVMNDKDEDVDYSSFIFVIYPEIFHYYSL
nr:hypothetical protein [Tanacetum cinerariifolium]